MKTVSEIIEHYDFWSKPRESFVITREEYQTLKSAVLAAQTTNSHCTPLKCKCGGNLKQAIMCDNCYESTFGSGI